MWTYKCYLYLEENCMLQINPEVYNYFAPHTLTPLSNTPRVQHFGIQEEGG